MECKTCVLLEEAALRARKPESAEMLSGLTEAGLRNHALQRQERQAKTQLELEKHQRTCPSKVEAPAA
jgi:hypothetical protein